MSVFSLECHVQNLCDVWKFSKISKESFDNKENLLNGSRISSRRHSIVVGYPVRAFVLKV